ncbi:hypothetical protein D3C87_249620 [compost metagenome]
MTKSEKKAQLNKMIAEFLASNDAEVLTQLRNDIYAQINKLPMSSNDRNNVEEAMYLWSYNSDRYIQNPKNAAVKISLMADFDAIVKTVDISLLSN